MQARNVGATTIHPKEAMKTRIEYGQVGDGKTWSVYVNGLLIGEPHACEQEAKIAATETETLITEADQIRGIVSDHDTLRDLLKAAWKAGYRRGRFDESGGQYACPKPESEEAWNDYMVENKTGGRLKIDPLSIEAWEAL